jgi:hypothetical protein
MQPKRQVALARAVIIGECAVCIEISVALATAITATMLAKRLDHFLVD